MVDEFAPLVKSFFSLRSLCCQAVNSLQAAASEPALYKQALVAAAEELRATNQCLAHARKQMKRRAVDQPASVAAPSPAPAAAPAASAKRAKTFSSALAGPARLDKLDIWSHSHTIIADQTTVAALVDAHSIPNLWILAAVEGYRPGLRPKYQVYDIDIPNAADAGAHIESAAPRKNYSLDPRKIIPLPSLADVPLAKRREFKVGERVLAVFPQDNVTTLYPATVAASKKKKHEYYTLQFDDDDVDTREVHVERICPLPEGKFGED